ncbi:MAG TPA: hypothetical protein VF708_07350 [Pyrinomonadaceae bacterium]|jgi:hypothetical protein
MSRFILTLMAMLMITCSGNGQTDAGSQSAGDASSDWLTYTDKAYAFTIRYPKTFVILRELKSRTAATPQFRHRVRFQDKQLATGQTAALEPPQFSIEVLDKELSLSLRDWVAAFVHIGAEDSVETFHLDGAGDGLRVRSAMQLAPNEFYYFARGKYIFKLTPLGQHGEEMLNSFRLDR